MLHFVFNRPNQTLKAFDHTGAEIAHVAASGDAWGEKYHHDGCIPPGQYLLTHVEPISPPIASEGAGQIYVTDVDAHSLEQLVAAKAVVQSDVLTVGGISLPFGELARFGRAEIMIHAGGSNAPEPLAPEQPLCKTYGCTRVHNADLPTLMDLVEDALTADELVVFSVLGDPLPVAC